MKKMVARYWYVPIVLVVLLMLTLMVLITNQSAYQRITLWLLFVALISLPVSWIWLFIFKERRKALLSIIWSIASICILFIPLSIAIISDPRVPNTSSDGRKRPGDLLFSNTVEEVAANTDVSYETSESEREIIRATNDFSFRLFLSVAANSKGKDVLISPLGVVYSLDLISNGAGGHTKQLLQKQLGTGKFNQDDINALRRKMMLCHAKVSLDDVYHTTKSAFLKSSNLLLYRDSQVINQDFVKTIVHSFFADCIPFTQQSEVKKILDTWNKEANRDAIKDVSIDIDDITRACLVNTLLFNASWAQMFYKTKKDKFYKTPKEVHTVDMMCNTEKEHYYKYMQNSQYQMLRLPYVGSFYMDVILPNKNITIDHLMARLDLKQYEESAQKLNTYDIVEVGLPKFHVKSELNLLQLLSDMGLSDLFSMSADYSLMSDSSLYINRMRQDIEMDIDEKGTHIEAVLCQSSIHLLHPRWLWHHMLCRYIYRLVKYCIYTLSRS